MTLSIDSKTSFPDKTAHFLLPSTNGLLEVYTQQPHPLPLSFTTIICHPHPLMGGTMHNKVITTLAQACHALNISTVRFNFRGVGESEGIFAHGKGELEDLLAVVQWVKSVKPDNKIIIAGFSFGSFIAASAENHFHLQQLLLIAPPVERFNFQALPPFKCPWSIIQGAEDVTVNPNAVLVWRNSRLPIGSYNLMPKADHFFHGQLLALRALMTTQLQITL